MTQFSVGSMTGFTWSAVIAAAALASLILMAVNGKKQGLKQGTVPVFGLLAVPLCVLAGRAGYYLFSLNRLNVIGVSFFALREGGLMLYGAMAGAHVFLRLSALLSFSAPYYTLSEYKVNEKPRV